MQLTWVHDQATGTLTCNITDDLSYTTTNGGGTITKTYNDEITELNGFDDWELEKEWISDNFSDIVGVYAPQWEITEESWLAEHPDWDQALPLFGINEDGEYLDKLCRPSFVQEGRDMQQVYLDGKIRIELDTDGNYWQRLWCEELDTFYNVQPCCVFPNNPGRKLLTDDEVQNLITNQND